MRDEVGVNAIQAMTEAQEAEALAEAMTFLGVDLEAAVEDLRAAASSHVSGGLDDYEADTHSVVSTVAQNGIALAENIQGADLEIVDADHENADEYRDALDNLNIVIND